MRTAGLLDLQVNGYAGVDFNDDALTPDALDHALAAMRASGVTQCLPTLITAPPQTIAARLHALDVAVRGGRLGPSMVPGYHLEGPFLNDSPGYRGCHPAEAMRDPDASALLAAAKGLFRPVLLTTLAPERPGGIEATRTLSEAGVTVAIGHSDADYAVVDAFADAGGVMSTHLGNGLPQDLPKLANTLLAQLAEPRLVACLIADGLHVPPAAFAALVRLKGRARCVLVTDAVCAAASLPGRYMFAGMEIALGSDGAVRTPGTAGLAGAALTLDQAVRNVVAWGAAEPRNAVAMASTAPLAVLASSLRRASLRVYPGRVHWSDELTPTIIEDGSIQ